MFNPAGTFHHADQNLVARLLAEVSVEGDVDVAALTSYRLIAHVVRLRGGRRFKLVAAGHEVFESPEVSA